MSEEKKLSPLQAIRRHCLWCCKGSPYEVDKCPATDCNLYPYRSGKTGRKKTNLTEEEREKMRERMRACIAARRAENTIEKS